MRELPILFNGPMVRAILAGRKTQTRRLASPQPHTVDSDGRWYRMPSSGLSLNCHPSPFGLPGDQLWVRETWGTGGYFPHPYGYRADCKEYAGERWRPSIHMPRAASRITLEVTGVRVERLQNISEHDADAEGFGGDFPTNTFPEYFPGMAEDYGHLSIPQCFGRIWDALGEPGAWDANPWVWVVEFKRLESGNG